MKDTLFTTLTTIGATLILGTATFFPWISLYRFVLDKVSVFLMGRPVPGTFLSLLLSGLPADPFPFRLKITIAAVIIAGAIILLMFLLRKVSRTLELGLFERVLTWGMFYVGIMTVLMLTGMWLDLRVVPGEYCRLAFIFSRSQ